MSDNEAETDMQAEAFTHTENRPSRSTTVSAARIYMRLGRLGEPLLAARQLRRRNTRVGS